MTTREEIAAYGFDEWIASFCKKHNIKAPNRGSYAYIIIRGLFDNLKSEMEVTTSLKNRMYLLSGTLQIIERALDDEGQAIAKSRVRDIISPAMERIKQWKRKRTSTSKSSQG